MLFASFFIFNTTVNSSRVPLAIIIAMLVLYLKKHGWVFKFKIYSFHLSILAFALFCILSFLWSEVGKDGITFGTTIIKILFMVSIFYLCFKDYDNLEPLLFSIVYGGYIVCIYYLFNYGGYSAVVQNASLGIRDTVEFANVNTIGRAMAIVIVTNTFLLINNKSRIMYFGIPLPIIIMFSTQSRMAFIMAAAGIIFMFFLYSLKNHKVVDFFVKLIVYTLLVMLLFRIISKLPITKGLFDRMSGLLNFISKSGDVDSSTEARLSMVELGIELFKSNPILGIGIGCPHYFVAKYLGYNAYLHNNYVELLAGGGIFGTILFYRIHLSLVKRIRKSKLFNKITIYCLTLIAMILLFDFAGVSYYFKETYYYFVIILLCVEKNVKYFANKNNNLNENIL